MKKQITLNRLLLFGSFALAVILIGSCKKDLLMGDRPNSFEPIPSARLTAVKQWYSRNEGLITSEFNWLNSLSPKWDSVRVQNNEKGSVYEAVLHNPDKIFATDGAVNLKDSRKEYAPKSSIRLLIFRDELGQSYRSCFMEVIATGESLLPQQLSYMNYGNLSGLVSFYELDGRLANSWVYSNGKAVMSTSANSGLRSGRTASSKSGANGRIMFDDGPPEGFIDCGNRLVAHTREVCGEVGGLEGGGYEGGEGSGKVCYDQLYFVSERIYCPIPPGGSGGGEYETPNPSGPGGGGNSNQGLDCTNPANFQTGVCAIDVVPLDTANYVTKPCMNDALRKALGKGAKGKVKALMDSTFLVNSSVNVDFYYYAIPVGNRSYGADAYTGPSANNPNHQLIVFNEDRLGNASQEYKVATIYHEVLHAYLAVLVNRDTDGNLIITNAHEDMVNNYIRMMAADLRGLFPNMDESDAHKLAMGGLQGTTRYSLLSQAQKADIYNTNIAYSTKPGPGVVGSQGSYCNN